MSAPADARAAARARAPARPLPARLPLVRRHGAPYEPEPEQAREVEEALPAAHRAPQRPPRVPHSQCARMRLCAPGGDGARNARRRLLRHSRHPAARAHQSAPPTVLQCLRQRPDWATSRSPSVVQSRPQVQQTHREGGPESCDTVRSNRSPASAGHWARRSCAGAECSRFELAI